MYSPPARKPLGLSGAEQKLFVLNLEGSCWERYNKVSIWPNTSPDSTPSRSFQAISVVLKMKGVPCHWLILGISVPFNDRNVSLCCSCPAVFRVLRGKTHLVLRPRYDSQRPGAGKDFGRWASQFSDVFFAIHTLKQHHLNPEHQN